MGFNLLLSFVGNGSGVPDKSWIQKLYELIPNININVSNDIEEARQYIEQADAAYGEVPPDLFEKAKNLRWIACPMAGPPKGYYHQALIESDVIVTNVRGIFNDHISAHIMSYVLAFARGLHINMHQQVKHKWKPQTKSIYLPESTAIIVGVGGIGGETAKLCSSFGMKVIGIDARLNESPTGVNELYPPPCLHDLLPRGDFVIVTVPETPHTQGMFGMQEFKVMKHSAYFINIGRGATVLLDDLTLALENREISGAGLDVFEIEPLPSDHKLWDAPGMIITPHVAALGPYLRERAAETFFQNCIRFNENKPLINVVDKANWF